jgi:hypothetical protein
MAARPLPRARRPRPTAGGEPVCVGRRKTAARTAVPTATAAATKAATCMLYVKASAPSRALSCRVRPRVRLRPRARRRAFPRRRRPPPETGYSGALRPSDPDRPRPRCHREARFREHRRALRRFPRVQTRHPPGHVGDRVSVTSIQGCQLASSSNRSQRPVILFPSSLNVPVNRSAALRIVQTRAPSASVRLAS